MAPHCGDKDVPPLGAPPVPCHDALPHAGFFEFMRWETRTASPHPTPETSPQATFFERMQWTVLNSGISLLGYWAAAALVDKHWYGRRLMQASGQ
jgi:hypothetical protein